MTGIGFHHNLSLSKVDIKKQERRKRLMVWEWMTGWNSQTKYVQDAFSTRSAPQIASQIASHSQMVLPHLSKRAEIWGVESAVICVHHRRARLFHKEKKKSAEVADDACLSRQLRWAMQRKSINKYLYNNAINWHVSSISANEKLTACVRTYCTTTFISSSMNK